jgi:DNA-binding winged helix-turn-helix (wHTH) protein
MDASSRDGKSYEFGHFVLDPTQRELTHKGSPVALSPNLFEALLYFVEHPGRAVSKEELLDAIWPGKVVAEANVSQTVFTLRRALTEAGAREQLIATAQRRGYRFTGAVQVLAYRAAPPTRATPAEDDLIGLIRIERSRKQSAPNSRVNARRVTLFAVTLLVILGGLVALRLRGAGHVSPAANVVALADFQNSTGDPIFDKTLDKTL